MEDVKVFWDQVLNEFNKSYSSANNLFDDGSKVLEERNGLVSVIVKNNLTKERINKVYINELEKIAANYAGKNIRFKFITKEEIDQEKERKRSENGKYNYLNRNFTFNNFVLGTSNRLAYLTAMKVATQPAVLTQTLYLFGDVGLGKTHLMQAIGNAFLDSHVESNVIYVKADMFLEEYGVACELHRSGADMLAINDFLEKYRKADIFLLDDIQVLGKAEKTQTVLFQLFDFLMSSNKQIIITSDKPAHDMQDIMARLRSRFESSLAIDISSPDYQLRIDILKYKLTTDIAEKIEIPDSVLDFIATNFTKNIRELEGALKRVISYSFMLGINPTVETAKEALQPLLTNKVLIDNMAAKRDYGKVQDVVCDIFNIDKLDLIGKKRNSEFSIPRHICMFYLKKNYDLPFKAIGEMFSGRDHSTVMSAVENIERLKIVDSQIKNTLEIISKKLSIN